MADFVEQDMDVLRVEVLQEIFLPDALAPVTTGTAAEVRCQPERLV